MLRRIAWLTLALGVSAACGKGDRAPPDALQGPADAAPVPNANDPNGVPDAGDDGSLCAKYGGAASVARIIGEQVLGRIAADCRIHAFFAGVTDAGMIRVKDCLAIQVQELMGCRGVTYAGAFASNGLECRDMRKSHIGLGISSADFDALIEDVVAGLDEAGMDRADIEAAAPALLALKPTIVEAPEPGATRAVCELPSDAQGAPDAGLSPRSDAGAIGAEPP